MFCKLIVEFNYIIIHLKIDVPLIYGNKLPKKQSMQIVICDLYLSGYTAVSDV